MRQIGPSRNVLPHGLGGLENRCDEEHGDDRGIFRVNKKIFASEGLSLCACASRSDGQASPTFLQRQRVRLGNVAFSADRSYAVLNWAVASSWHAMA